MSDRANPSSPPNQSTRFAPFFLASDLPDDLVQRLCEVVPSPIFATVDKASFVRHIGASHSLSACEKWRCLDSLVTLSQFQIDVLLKVMQDEALEFSKLAHRDWDAISLLTARAWLHLCLVADYFDAGYADEQQERAALATMLQRKFSEPEQRRWVEMALQEGAVARHVFSAFTEGNARRSKRPARLKIPASF